MTEIILLALASLFSFYVVKKLSKKTKMETQILYLILGILLGVILQHTKFNDIEGLFPMVSSYNMFALLFMFFVTGFTIDLAQIKKSGAVTARLFSFPPYLETFVMTIVIFLVVLLIPSLGFHLSLAETLVIAAIFSMASPANIVPICSEMIRSGQTGKNNMPGTMILASLADGFITIPIIFPALFVVLTRQTEGKIPVSKLILVTLGSILAILIAIAVGMLIGKGLLFVFEKLFYKLSDKDQSKFKDYLVILIAFGLVCLVGAFLRSVESISKAVTLFGILIACGAGFAMNQFDSTGVSKIIRRDGNKLFAMFGMPIIFMYVGASIDLRALLTLRLLVLFAFIAFLAVSIKALTAVRVLKDNKYTAGEKRFVAFCLIPKGVSLINFSVILGTLLDPRSDLVVFMTMLAAVSVILTMSIGIPLIRKSKGAMILREE